MGNRDGAGLLVGEWLYRWLDDRITPARKVGTQERYEIIIRRQIIPHLGDVRLTALTPAAIDEMQSELLRSGLSASTVRNAHTVLAAACKEAVRMGYVQLNPTASVAPPVRRQRRVIPPTVSVVRDLLDLARDEDHRLYPFLHLLVYTGMRRGEALALRWENVNLPDRYITVSEAAVKTRSRGMMLTDPKSQHSHRTIDLDDETVAVLQAHRKRQTASGVKAERSDALVFPGRDGSPMAPSYLHRQLKNLGELVGAPDVTFHSLRHFHATFALQQHQNPVVVSRRMGHSSVSMTLDTYGHSIPGWQRQTAEAFAKGLRRPG